MSKWYVTRIYIYIKSENCISIEAQNALKETLEAGRGAKNVAEKHEAKNTVVEQAAKTIVVEPVDKSVLETIVSGEINKNGILVITDDAGSARFMAGAGIPTLGVLHADNKNDSFLGVDYLAEGLEGVDAEFCEQIYRRAHKIPWDIVETKRCLVRETVVQDVDSFYDIYSNPAITEYMEPLFEDRDEEYAYIESYQKSMYGFCGYGIWTVTDKTTGQVIGRAGFDLHEGHELPELGFMIGVPWQRKGLATEVCEAILKYGEEILGFYLVDAFAEVGNTGSEHFLEKLGFTAKGPWEEKGKCYTWYQKSF